MCQVFLMSISVNLFVQSICPFTGKSHGTCPWKSVGAEPDVTNQGCTCKSNCGSSLDTGASKCDWYVRDVFRSHWQQQSVSNFNHYRCLTSNNCGRQSPIGSWDFCTFPQNKTYEMQSAEAKLNNLWSLISANQTSGSYPSPLAVLLESVATSFENNKDWMPAGCNPYRHPDFIL